jgi:hypothetical protein
MRRFALLILLFFSLSASGQIIISLDENQANGNDNFSQVGPGDIVLIECGVREELILQNFHGTSDRPIIFMPSVSTQNVVISSSKQYGISVRNCSHIKISGWQGYEERYGIRIINLSHPNSAGIGMGYKSTNVELEYLEIANTGFAGILSKTEPDCNDPGTLRGAFIQKDTKIHHCYIHDTGGEGIYVGSTSYFGQEMNDCGLVYPHLLEGVEVHHNRIEKSGWDGIQISSVVSGCKIYNNVLTDCSINETNAQMSGILIGGGTLADCYNNLILDSHGTGILIFGSGGTKVFNNVIVRPGKSYAPGDSDKREHGIYIDDKTDLHHTYYGIYSNTIIQPKSDGIRVSSSFQFQTRIYNNIIVDPGAWDVYENDNTDRTGNDSFVYFESSLQPAALAANAFVLSISDPRFVNASIDDYHLSENSQYIDSGRNLSDQGNVNFDFDGKTRPLNGLWDIGAYEYGPGSHTGDIDLLTKPVIVSCSPDRSVTCELNITVLTRSEFSITVFNVSGQTLFSLAEKVYNPGVFSIPFNTSGKGLLLLQLVGRDWSISEKLIVN